MSAPQVVDLSDDQLSEEIVRDEAVLERRRQERRASRAAPRTLVEIEADFDWIERKHERLTVLRDERARRRRARLDEDTPQQIKGLATHLRYIHATATALGAVSIDSSWSELDDDEAVRWSAVARAAHRVYRNEIL